MNYRINQEAADKLAAWNKRQRRNEIITGIIGGMALAGLIYGLCHIEPAIKQILAFIGEQL